MRKPQRQNSPKQGRRGAQGRRRAAGGSKRPAPQARIENGPILPLTLERLAWGGDAIARHEDGRIVFVEGGFPGDQVRAQLVEDGKRFCRATLVETTASDISLQRACPTADSCGGCRFQGVPYAQELQWKIDALKDMLQRLSRETQWPEISVVPAPLVEAYRERVRLRVDDAGQTGYLARNSRDFVPALRCDVIHPALEAARPWAGNIAAGLPRVHSLRMEWDRVRAQVVVEIPCDSDSWDDVRRALVQRLAQQEIPALTYDDAPVQLSVTIRHQYRWEALLGDGHIQRWFGGARVDQRSGNFSQANAKLNETLRERVADWVAEGWNRSNGTQRVIDLYAGAGNLSFALAARQARVVAIDHASEAIEAGENALLEPRIRRVANWVTADLSRGPYDALNEHLERVDAIVLDPPRGGVAAEFIEVLGRSDARKIVYVSCDPSALARDISRLHGFGWRVTRVEAWDMFPRTAHVEVLAELSRNW